MADKKHRIIQNKIIKNNQKLSSVDVLSEFCFNNYGLRGYCDVVVRQPKTKFFPIESVRVIEIKTNAADFGEGIRQLNNAELYFKQREGYKFVIKDFVISKNFFPEIIESIELFSASKIRVIFYDFPEEVFGYILDTRCSDVAEHIVAIQTAHMKSIWGNYNNG